MCELELGLLENLEPKRVLKPETVFELDPVVLLVLKTVSALAVVPGMMLESMIMSELEMAPEGSLFPKNVSETETIHQDLLKLGLGSMSDLREVMKLGLIPQFELMREPSQELRLIPVMMKVKGFLALMVALWLELESVMEPEQEQSLVKELGLKVEPKEKLEKGPGLLFVKQP